MTLRIEVLAEEHVSAVAAIEQQSFSLPWSPAMIREEIANPLAVYRAVKDGNSLAGYAGMQIILDEGYITNVATAPDYRRRGVGDLLMGALLTLARDRKLSFLTLEVRRSNVPAIALYEKHGFTVAGVRPGYYEKPREDALLMTRYL